MRRFSNAQVTAMVIAVCVAILATPVGVMAAIDQVRVSDGTEGGDIARVEDGRLRVGDGNGPVTVDGTMDSRIALPTTPFHVDGALAAAPFHDLEVVQRRGRGQLALTSVIATSAPDTSGGYTSMRLQSWVANAPDWDCSGSKSLPAGSFDGVNVIIHAPVADTAAATWPTPLILFPQARKDTTSCLLAYQSVVGGQFRHTDFTLDGFWVGI